MLNPGTRKICQEFHAIQALDGDRNAVRIIPEAIDSDLTSSGR